MKWPLIQNSNKSCPRLDCASLLAAYQPFFLPFFEQPWKIGELVWTRPCLDFEMVVPLLVLKLLRFITWSVRLFVWEVRSCRSSLQCFCCFTVQQK